MKSLSDNAASVHPAEREGLRGQGFAFHDRCEDAARLVASWDTRMEHASALARTIARL
ncbi:hypothetical protein [Novosphingobium endophyticum]|nr:hypothetical protein [Novosphingobium endophyticum]